MLMLPMVSCSCCPNHCCCPCFHLVWAPVLPAFISVHVFCNNLGWLWVDSI
uniref:Uncharacterized protein n=1 Tax=Anguilla anguilla TaxID=7936 RepID=A0A0E9T4H3_ANGAN